MTTLGLFVKHPVAGQVKTRLGEALGAALAAAAYAAFITDLRNRFQATAQRRVLCFSPPTAPSRTYFTALAGNDFELWPQPEVDLGGRMESFFRTFARGPYDCSVIVGSDSPTLPIEIVEQAFERLHRADVVLGPATDGGFYLIGQRGFSRPIFESIEWSTSRVLAQTVAAIERCSASLTLLPPWYDVDTSDDWQLLIGHLQALRASGALPPGCAVAALLAWDTAGRLNPL
ncbi:MAG: glycosyltransferase [Planctomycetaceae bacterium]|nr:glycosyltransferase [Planctomycetaceae bacterium]